ncbi:MAG: TRAP transporter large permease [Emcibacter sp.]|nr:TRAP transporter large permease [Emcibacter sp.]
MGVIIRTVIILGLLLVIIFAGVSIPYATGSIATALFLFAGYENFIETLPKRIFSQLDIFALMAMPLFILVGELMNRGGVTDALIRFSQLLVGRFRGGLGHTNIMTSVFFAGISGAAMADAAALSNTLVPAMKKQGYTARYAAAITAASAIIGPIIPPSIILIFYGAVMGVDVAALFVAGIVPGLMLAVFLMGVNAVAAMRYDHPGGKKEDIPPLLPTVRRSLPSLMLPVIIMAGIMFGWMTPTEAAAVAVFAALLIGYLYGQANTTMVYQSLKKTISISGTIFLMIGAASCISFIATLTMVPQMLSDFVISIGVSGDMFLIVLMVLFLIMGMVAETQIALILVAPLLVPIAIMQGADPVHMGIVVCLNLSMGLISPPLGGVLLVTSTVAKINYWALVRTVLPFFLLEVGLLAILILFPELTLFLPRALDLI